MLCFVDIPWEKGKSQWAGIEGQANIIFSLYLTEESWSVSWLVLEQIPKSGGEKKTSGYIVKAKQKNTKDKQNPKKLKK